MKEPKRRANRDRGVSAAKRQTVIGADRRYATDRPLDRVEHR